MQIIILAIIFILWCVVYFLIHVISQIVKKRKTPSLDFSNLGEWSFQRYAKFYGNIVLPDTDYIKKIVNHNRLHIK